MHYQQVNILIGNTKDPFQKVNGNTKDPFQKVNDNTNDLLPKSNCENR